MANAIFLTASFPSIEEGCMQAHNTRSTQRGGPFNIRQSNWQCCFAASSVTRMCLHSGLATHRHARRAPDKGQACLPDFENANLAIFLFALSKRYGAR